jgi:hypothetical protein
MQVRYQLRHRPGLLPKQLFHFTTKSYSVMSS